MTAPTFNGNLSGNANTAGKAATAAVGPAAGSAQSAVTFSEAADSNTGQPNATVMFDYLNQNSLGIRRLDIDPFDDFKNTVNRAENYGGISSVDLSTALARSKLRDPNNLKNQSFTGALVTEGIISVSYTHLTLPTKRIV